MKHFTHGLNAYVRRKCRCEVCVQAKREKDREYYKAHAESRRKYIAEWRKKNPNYQHEWEVRNREARTEYQRILVEKKGEAHKASRREYRAKHREEISRYNKKYRAKNLEREIERGKQRRIKCADKIKEYSRAYGSKRYKEDVIFRLANTLRVRINRALQYRFHSRSASLPALIGCSVQYLKRHLESQFVHGMGWENRSDWHIDHIRPCAEFDLSTLNGQKDCFHWTNLQPLWKHENLSKGKKVNWTRALKPITHPTIGAR